jgi:glycosyltransferase involved in cell wall biosynthesis
VQCGEQCFGKNESPDLCGQGDAQEGGDPHVHPDQESRADLIPYVAQFLRHSLDDSSGCRMQGIVPCRNERGNIEGVVQRIPQMGREAEIIFIDGNSSDATVEEIERQIREHQNRKISLIHQGEGIGKGDAAKGGFAAAKGDVLVIQDADLTAPPEDLPKFFRALRDGKGEFINGSHLVYPMEKQAMRFLNLLGNRFFGALFSWLLGQRFRDTLCGRKMIRREHYELIAAN